MSCSDAAGRGVRLIVVAKSPVPGKSKTRLCPPCTPEEAADVARAALADTLETVAAAPAMDRVLALEGEPGEWLPIGFRVLPQRGGGLDERISNAFADAAATDGPAPALLVGMDTPQVTPALLAGAAEALLAPGVDGVLGPALDGGWWAMGVRRPDPRHVLGVPMSSADTLRAQRERWDLLGMRRRELPPLVDIDTFADARDVAALIPGSRTARIVAALTTAMEPASW